MWPQSGHTLLRCLLECRSTFVHSIHLFLVWCLFYIVYFFLKFNLLKWVIGFYPWDVVIVLEIYILQLSLVLIHSYLRFVYLFAFWCESDWVNGGSKYVFMLLSHSASCCQLDSHMFSFALHIFSYFLLHARYVWIANYRPIGGFEYIFMLLS